MSTTAGSSTVPDTFPDVASERRSRLLRAAVLAVLLAFVVAGLAGAFGVASRTISAGDRDGLRAELTYAQRARAGLAVPFELRIHRPGGFDGPIVVTTETDYLSAFDENGLNPDPDASSTDASTTTWEYDAPDGETFTVWLDMRLEPGVQWRRRGTTVVSTGDEQVTLHFTTWAFP